MAKQSIESMYALMFKMRDSMEDLLQDAQELTAASKTYGGEISRVLTEQLSKYYAPAIKKLIDDESTPGAIIGLIRFMDSVPLALTRIEPSMEDVAPLQPENPQLQTPVESSSPAETVEALPQNTSFAQPVEQPVAEEPVVDDIPQEDVLVRESVMREDMINPEVKKYQVVRKTTVGSSLGEDVANLKDAVVCSFDSEEDAQNRADILNDSVEPYEKDAFGLHYDVEEFNKAFNTSAPEEK